jgi:putative nucleotidyltransferase with HDIG domain
LAQNDSRLRAPDEFADLIARIDRFFAAEGVEAMVAGGFVRDVLLLRAMRDIDVSVSGDPLELAPRLAEAIGASHFPLDSERRHVRLLVRDPDVVVDLLPLRGKAEDDLRLRDFTVDAMGVELPELASGSGQVLDPTGGLRDLHAGVLRLVSGQALVDDPLRMLRGVRLAAQLGFGLEAETERLIREGAATIGEAAVDRQRDELLLIMATDRAAPALRLMDSLGLLAPVLPELDVTRGVEQPKEHHRDVFGHLIEAVAALDWILADDEFTSQAGSDDPDMRAELRAAQRELWGALGWWEQSRTWWAEELSPGVPRKAVVKLCALLHDIGKPQTKSVEPSGRIRFFGHSELGAEMAARLLRRMRFPTRIVRHVSTMIEEHLRPVLIAVGRTPSRRAIFRFFRDAGEAGIDTVIMSLADHVATVGPRFSAEGWRRHVAVVNYMLRRHLEAPAPPASPSRLLDGDDIMRELGLEPGRTIGELLRVVREAHEEGDISTREEALALARAHLERSGGSR